MSSPLYIVSSGVQALTGGVAKIGIQLATATGVINRWTQCDITFDSANSANTPCKCELVKTTSVSASGTTATLQPMNSEARSKGTASTTARIGDTTDGGSPTILATWFVPVVAGQIFQLPLGRELTMEGNMFYELRLNAPQGVNAAVNLQIEE